MRKDGQRDRNAGRRGVAAVECALVLPALLLLVFGTIEVSTLLRSWLTIQKAAESGARLATTGKGLEDRNRLALVVAETNRMLESLPAGPREVVVRSWPQGSASARENDAGGPCEMVEVEVRYTYSPITPIAGDAMPDSIAVGGSVKKVNEPWNPCD